METPAVKIAVSEENSSPKGFTIHCPCCGCQEATVTVSLADPEAFYCVDCEADFQADDVREFIAKWSKVLAWTALFPAAE